MQARSVVRGKLGEGVEWQSPLWWSVLLPGRDETSPFPGVLPCAETGRQALGAIMAGGSWKRQHS